MSLRDFSKISFDAISCGYVSMRFVTVIIDFILCVYVIPRCHLSSSSHVSMFSPNVLSTPFHIIVCSFTVSFSTMCA